MTDNLEHGGIQHAHGNPCPTGQPYPHPYTTACNPVRTTTTAHDPDEAMTPLDTNKPRRNFELPTVGLLRHQVDQLTRERDHLAAQLQNAPTTLDWAAVNAERNDLRTRSAELEADLGDIRTRLVNTDRTYAQTARERDQLRELLDATMTARDNYRSHLARMARALRRIHTAAHELINALDEGDIDTVSRIERLREALDYEPDTRMTLTDKARETLGSLPPATGSAGSVPGVAREDLSEPDTLVDVKGSGDPIASSVTHPTRSMHKSDYGVPKTGEVDKAPTTAESGTPARYMMATRAIVTLGDISRDTPDLARIWSETADDWIGEWVEGYGYINVRFPKTTTRELTPEEIERYDGKTVQAGNGTYTIHIPGAEP